MKETYTCAGCGVPVQTEDKQALGYVPKSALNRDVIICQRCFRLKHYNEIPDVSLSDDDFLKLLSQIGQTDALVVKIVDIFDFNGSWVPGLQRFVGQNDILLVGNKVDLLPKSTNQNKLKNWMRHSAKELGLRPIDVLLMSAEKSIGISEVANAIERYSDGRDVYIVGSTNVGKSTFINQLIKHFGDDEGITITTSQFPGTTLNFIDIPLNEDQTLYDTPGVVNQHQAAHFISPDDYKKVFPKKEIKPKVFQLNEEQTLFLGGLARFDYISGGRRSVVCYVSNEMYIHRTKSENADQLFESQYGKLLSPPSDPKGLPELRRYDFTVKENDMDIVFSGLGWVTVKGTGAKIQAYAPEGIGVLIRPSIIKG
ncbi:ribosome biogenesis GTPase YqeH [Scopulibacillus daqui]|uniref:Ribosome biogenesis GTPase YqeH n=1 Tax=Scopulibacillus daqui TaxID=1469162 RepID=A0ABS2Q0K6_9BACL|nr:ribosome biogenesis GTPase YqeH [Scopulibacillus daqui]MBM7645830.1 ribosome biogenesis GTPase YqeH [Scopulibacillus daqui]